MKSKNSRRRLSVVPVASAMCFSAALLAACGGGNGGLSSTPTSVVPNATAPLESYPMRIKNDASVEITFGTGDHRCMLKVPPTTVLQPTDAWKGDIITNTDEKCKDYGAKFVLIVDSSVGDADGEWQKSPGAPWRVIKKSELRLCIVEVGGALDVAIVPEPFTGCASR